MVDDQIAAALASVGQGQHIVSEKLVLNAEIEVVVVRSLEVGYYGESIEWRSPSRIRTIEWSSDRRIEADVIASRSRRVVASGKGIIRTVVDGVTGRVRCASR